MDRHPHAGRFVIVNRPVIKRSHKAPEHNHLPPQDERQLPGGSSTGIHSEGEEARADGEASAGSLSRFGLALRPLTPDECKYAHVQGGLLVKHASGFAESAGLQAGDIVLSAYGIPLRTVNQLQQIVVGQDQEIILLIACGNTRIVVPVRLA